MNSRLLLAVLLPACLPLHAQIPASVATPESKPAEPALDWHDITKWGVEGRA